MTGFSHSQLMHSEIIYKHCWKKPQNLSGINFDYFKASSSQSNKLKENSEDLDVYPNN